MKVVLFGKDGQLGWELQRVLSVAEDVISFNREQVDVSDPDVIQRSLNESRPNLIINASAYTDVDGAEEFAEFAMKINAQAPGVMARMARSLGATFIHFSTDYVFDGKSNSPYVESDPTNPLNVYGKTKLMGEENIQQAGGAFLILRTSWVYSLRRNSFVNKVLGWARKSKVLRVVDDQVGNPTWARMLAENINLLLAKNKVRLYESICERSGIYHLAGHGYTSRYKWAEQILINDPMPSEQVVRSLEPARSDEFPTPAVRPLFSALDCAKFEKVFGLRLPAWEDSLKLAMSG